MSRGSFEALDKVLEAAWVADAMDEAVVPFFRREKDAMDNVAEVLCDA